jgi:high-affinity iron transporter
MPVGVALLGALLLAWVAATTQGGPPDPTDAASLSRTSVVIDSAVLVLREGLEAILVLAVVLAALRGANTVGRRPIALGAGAALAAAVATWFIVEALLSAVDAPELAVQAATGLVAVVVLMLVMNWFLHRVYWTDWLSAHRRRGLRLVAADDAKRGLLVLGFVALGFTAVYREGFEVVLFLQNLRLQAGSSVVLEGVALGLAGTFAIGALTFAANARLPYKRLLVATAWLLGFVFVVMVGETAQEMQLAGWLPTTPIDVAIPGWMGTWFALFPTVETIAAQLSAAAFVIGSYFVARRLRVSAPRGRGERPAIRPEAPPVAPGP